MCVYSEHMLEAELNSFTLINSDNINIYKNCLELKKLSIVGIKCSQKSVKLDKQNQFE